MFVDEDGTVAQSALEQSENQADLGVENRKFRLELRTEAR
jgi:hypothetical protein